MKKINWYIKAIISVLTFVYLFFKIRTYPHLHELNLTISKEEYEKFILLLVILVLIIPNWLLESIKWKILVEHVEKISLKSSLRAVLGGISVSMLTPNRIGEIPGRAAFISPGNRRKTMIASAIGSLSQSIITAFTGFIAFLIMKLKYEFEILPFKQVIITLIIIIIFILVFTWLVLFFKQERCRYLKKFRSFISFLYSYSKKEIAGIQILSFTRYFIFITQFYFLLLIFEVNINIDQALLSISLTYLILFITPFLTIAEIGARGSASLLCIGYFSNNISGILMAGFSLWIINLVIPAMIGSILIFKRR